jgi:predicted permease
VKEGGRVDVKRMLKAPLTSIPFLTHVVMVILNLNSLTPPKIVVSFAEILGNANAFLAMLMIGVGFKLELEKSKLGRVIRLLALRYLMAALLALCFWFLLPFERTVRLALVILAVSPISTAVPGFTEELKSDIGLSCSVNSLSILISIVAIVTLLVTML